MPLILLNLWVGITSVKTMVEILGIKHDKIFIQFEDSTSSWITLIEFIAEASMKEMDALKDFVTKQKASR